MKPGEEVQIETGDAHDRVVCVFLVSRSDIGGAIPDVGEVVVGRVEGLEEGRRSRKERDVLDVRVMFL